MEKKTRYDEAGKSFEELSENEMESTQGQGDVNPETTPICVSATVTASAVGLSAALFTLTHKK